MININNLFYKKRSWNLYDYCILIVIFYINLPNACLAGSFNVNPVKIELSVKNKTDVINIENTSDHDTSIQVKAWVWSQKNGEEILQITKDIIVTPKIFKIKAGSTQIIRVGTVRSAEKNEELSYRLFFEEIPSPPAPDFKGLQIALKISIPIFIAAVNPKEQIINFSDFKLENDKLKFYIKNIGSVHVRFISIKIYTSENKEKIIGIYEPPTYLLPKSEKSIEIKIDQLNLENLSKIKIKAQTLTGLIESDAILSKP